MKRLSRTVLMAVALAFPFAVAHAQQPGQQERLLAVTGEGAVQAKPDMAVISLGVVSKDDSAGVALAANTQAMTEVLDALKAEGLESRDLQTSGFRMEPVYSHPTQDQIQQGAYDLKLLGYSVRNTLTVRVRDLDRLGPILDKAIKLGANSVSGPSFTVEDDTSLQDDARRAAMEDALRKASLYAEAAGVTLGPIFHIEESFSRRPQPLGNAAALRLEDSAVPIESGELSFEAQVSVSWQLAD